LVQPFEDEQDQARGDVGRRGVLRHNGWVGGGGSAMQYGGLAPGSLNELLRRIPRLDASPTAVRSGSGGRCAMDVFLHTHLPGNSGGSCGITAANERTAKAKSVSAAFAPSSDVDHGGHRRPRWVCASGEEHLPVLQVPQLDPVLERLGAMRAQSLAVDDVESPRSRSPGNRRWWSKRGYYLVDSVVGSAIMALRQLDKVAGRNVPRRGNAAPPRPTSPGMLVVRVTRCQVRDRWGNRHRWL